MNVRFFVEGKADRKFLMDYLFHLGYVEVSAVNFIELRGKTNIFNLQQQFLVSQEKGNKNLLFVDADSDFNKTREDVEKIKRQIGVEFELFIIPNNRDIGNLETLLEQIINLEHKPLLECFENYKQCLISKSNPSYKIPDAKSKIFAYLDALLLKKEDEKLAKEENRDYRNAEHWNLNALYLEPLKNFLQTHLNS